ncbi:hypothetical protein ZWY2020_056727 [Hordeum vulgare]|nr:hypothetical protein ZWY2020_056727 [Hordeum vulgare]
MANTTGTHTASGSSAEANDEESRPIWFGSHCFFINKNSTMTLPRQFGTAATTTPPPTTTTAARVIGPPLFIPSTKPSSSRQTTPARAPTQASRTTTVPPPHPEPEHMLPPFMPPPSTAELPLIAPPPCLILEVDHMCFVHLASPMHNPFGFIKRALDAKRNNPSVAVTSSSRGAALLSFPNRDARWNVTGLGDIEFEGNTLSFERVEHTNNRAMANFDDLMDIEANDFPTSFGMRTE